MHALKLFNRPAYHRWRRRKKFEAKINHILMRKAFKKIKMNMLHISQEIIEEKKKTR